MSCPEFIYTPAGRQGIGVIQPQSGLDYPLVKPSEDIRYLLADFYLAYDDAGEYFTDIEPAVLPLRIKYLLNIGCEPNDLPEGAPVPTHAADVVVVDSLGREVLNTAAEEAVTCTTTDWGDNYKIYEWTTPDAVCRLVAHTTWKTGEPEPKNYLQYLAPENATLDERAVEKMPRRLRSLRVRQKSGTLVNGPYTGKIRFKNSYNTEIVAAETTTTDFVVTTRVNFSAAAGSGAGYFPVCGSGYDEETNEQIPQPIKQINGIAATPAGDFLMVGNDCMYIRRPTVSEAGGVRPSTTAQQQIGADCKPCCACTDYVDTALYMNQLGTQYQTIGQRVSGVKAIHEANVDKWYEKRACTVGNPIKLIMVPQCCPLVDVVMMLCNPCSACYLPSTLTLNLSSPDAAGFELECGSTTLFGPDGDSAVTGIGVAQSGGGTLFTAQLPAVKAGGSAYVKFRVRALASSPAAITGTATGTFVNGSAIQTGCPEEASPDERQPAAASKSITLTCTSDGGDNRPCAIS
jgi:hypothetical protein